MTRVLVVSGDPIARRMAGPAIRALELARALDRRGCAVTLAAPPPRSPPPPSPLGIPSPLLAYGGGGRALADAAARVDAVLVGGLVLARQPRLAALDVPLVVDLHGPFVLENLVAGAAGGRAAAGRRRRHKSDLAALQWQLARGDLFLCASEPQRDFWLGMLCAGGRVNPATYGADPTLRRLIDVVPFGLPDEPPRPAAAASPLRGRWAGISRADRVVLWGGGLWDWMDPLTPIRAVAELTRQRADIRLVFMGLANPGPDVPPMAMPVRAAALADELGLTDRVVFFHRDWVPYDERAGWLLEADAAVSCHGAHVETRLAFRTRLLDCIWTGLPMVVSGGDVLAERVAADGLGRVVPPGDVAATARALAQVLDTPGGRAAWADRFAGARAELAWSRVVEPLARFLAAPERAPDRPASAATRHGLPATPPRRLPARAWAILHAEGPRAVVAETARYLRWRRRSR